MIKATELRIGNYIQVGGNTMSTYQTYKPYRVTVEVIQTIKEENEERPDAFLSVFRPIALTREILKECGFIEYAGGFLIDKIYYMLPQSKGFDFCITQFKEGKKVNLNNIESLHHLQNMYFFLTGTELNIDLEETIP